MTPALDRLRIARFCAGATLVAALSVQTALVGCGGQTARPNLAGSEGGAAMDGADGADSPQGEDAGACGSLPDAVAPAAPELVVIDGSVPIESLSADLAVARCTYWSKCSPLAHFVVEDCIEGMSQVPPRWSYPTGAWVESAPNAALYQAIDAGLVRYDAVASAACFEALVEQDCHGPTLWADLPECTGVLTCAMDDDAGADRDGSACVPFGLPLFESDVPTCATSQDCVNVVDDPGGPYCFENHCVAAPCGSFEGDYCSSVVGMGGPCDSDAPFLGSEVTSGDKPCAAGLTCRGFSAEDGGLGICSTPEDLGGSCMPGTPSSGCAIGLVCECGRCALPPTGGSCLQSGPSLEAVFGQCQYGVAYCASSKGSTTCLPVVQAGGDCSNSQACAPALVCSETTSTCAPTLN